MNKSLLLRVADAIEAHPEQFDMEFWDCGTTACIGGWAERLAGHDFHSSIASFRNLVDLTVDDMQRLCYLSRWPEETSSRYANAPDASTAARIAADYIREFVRSHENSG